MKNKILYTLTCLAMLCTGCSLDRFPMNGPSSGTFPASEEEAQAGLLSAYKAIANMQRQYSPYNRFFDNITDIACFRENHAKATIYKELCQSIATSENEVVEDLYGRIYRTVGRVHMVLDNLENIRPTLSDDDVFWQFKAELLLIRAYMYDWACQYYGDIPFIDHSLTLEDYAYPRMPREQVIDRILADLDDELLDHLPVSWPRDSWRASRIGRATAYTIKARINLNWGRFEEAARCSKIAMELSKGVYELTPLDITYCGLGHSDGEPTSEALFGFTGEATSKEWMWAVEYNLLTAANTHGSIYALSSRVHNGAAYQGPTQALMDTFQCTDGKSIVESDKYNPAKPWQNRDPRLDLYTLRPDTRCMGIQYTTDRKVTKVLDYNQTDEKTGQKGVLITNADVAGNKSEYGPNSPSGPGGYLWRKFTSSEFYGQIVGGEYQDVLDCCLIRYAELLLIDAEANIEWEGGDLKRAADDLNQVRARVKMPKVDGSSRESLRKALRYERKVELCAEGFRWFDLRRWGNDVAKKALNGTIYAPGFENVISNAKPVIDDDWIVKYDENSTWDGKPFNLRKLTSYTMKYVEGKDELWPFPYNEMLTNPEIGFGNNNPGY